MNKSDGFLRALVACSALRATQAMSGLRRLRGSLALHWAAPAAFPGRIGDMWPSPSVMACPLSREIPQESRHSGRSSSIALSGRLEILAFIREYARDLWIVFRLCSTLAPVLFRLSTIRVPYMLLNPLRLSYEMEQNGT